MGQAADGPTHLWVQSVRVRSHGLAARVEVPEERITDLLQPLLRRELVKTFLSLGFTSVSVDVEGLVSGKLNRV